MADINIAIIITMTLKSKIIWLLLTFTFVAWQLWEEFRYGDNPAINIFSSGDFHRWFGL